MDLREQKFDKAAKAVADIFGSDYPCMLVVGEWSEHETELAAKLLFSTNIEETALPGKLQEWAVLIKDGGQWT